MDKVIDLSHHVDFFLVFFFFLTALCKQIHIHTHILRAPLSHINADTNDKRIHTMAHVLPQKFQKFPYMTYIFSQKLFILTLNLENTNELCKRKSATT